MAHNDPYASLLKRVPALESEGAEPRKKRKRDAKPLNPLVTESSSELDDDEDFEDVSLDMSQLNGSAQLYNSLMPSESSDVISVTINPAQPVQTTKKRQTHTVISKDERLFRLSYHKTLLILMLAHGQIRNQWCNDVLLKLELVSTVPRPIRQGLKEIPTSKALDSVKHRKLLDALGQLLIFYRRRFRVTCQGLIRKNWNELSVAQNKTESGVDRARFQQLILNWRGSRDTAAQGFVALCRSIGLTARLVFSIQTPDYTSTVQYPKQEDEQENNEEKQKEVEQPNPRAPSGKSQFLAQVRAKSPTLSEPKQNRERKRFADSAFPIFWTEVWSSYTKKWISIDPVVIESLEVCPMRRKSKFEPPLTETRNQLYYAIAYGPDGSVVDVTRRYSQYYNARTVKKKIQFRSEEDAEWYSRLLRCASRLRARPPNEREILERIEFRNRDLAEGIPNNLADFKNHPVYALESQLRQNEVIYPNDESSKCGTFRNKSSSKKGPIVTPIYKRSHVYLLRPARAWYMRGRVLKVGVQPLKEAEKKAPSVAPDGSDNEEDETTRLYAEFQTQIYVAPAIENGIIPKNVYGNIDVYTENMLPPGTALIHANTDYPLKMAERAARIIEVDYAKAVVAFDFARGPNARKKVAATAREGGIVIEEQYKEALFAVMDLIREEDIVEQQQKLLATALNNWRFFLVKLRITERLNAQHGQIKAEEEGASDDTLNNSDSDISLHSESSGPDVSDDMLQQSARSRRSSVGSEPPSQHPSFIASSEPETRTTNNDWQPKVVYSDSESGCEVNFEEPRVVAETRADNITNTDWQPQNCNGDTDITKQTETYTQSAASTNIKNNNTATGWQPQFEYSDSDTDDPEIVDGTVLLPTVNSAELKKGEFIDSRGAPQNCNDNSSAVNFEPAKSDTSTEWQPRVDISEISQHASVGNPGFKDNLLADAGTNSDMNLKTMPVSPGEIRILNKVHVNPASESPLESNGPEYLGKTDISNSDLSPADTFPEFEYSDSDMSYSDGIID